MIHLDASFAVAALGEGSASGQQLERWLAAGFLVHMSVIAWSEYLCGPAKPLDAAKVRFAQTMVREIVPFTADDARLASELFNAADRRLRNHVDCMIAATAIRCDAALATFNRRNFARFGKLRLAHQL